MKTFYSIQRQQGQLMCKPHQGVIRHLLLLMLMLFCLPLSAQELSVKNMEFLPDDPTARLFENQREDNNGTIAGIVKVIIALDGVKFDGASLLHQEERGMGEYWVWMADRATRLTVRTRNYQPLEINFRNYDFQMIHSKNTYKLVITVPTMGAQPQDDGMGYLAMKVEPSNANVVVDGDIKQPQENTNNEYMILLPRGEHSFQVSAAGYASQSGTVSIEKKKKEMTVKLVSSVAQLNVECPTTGAQVYVNEQLKGSVPWSGSLGPDTYRIEVRKNGFRSQTKTVTLSESATQTVTFQALSTITGNLNIVYTPMGSDVYIDGKKVGTTPDIFRDIPIGSHKVEIRKDGYTTASLNAMVKENETKELMGSLITPTTTVTKESKYRTLYVVESKETVYSICRKFGVDMADFLAANPQINKEKLKKGMAVAIPYTKTELQQMSLNANGNDQGMTPAQMVALGYDYQYGRNGKSIDYAEAVKWYRKAAEQGDASAMYCLGECYAQGHGVTKNILKAIEWYEKSADDFDTNAEYALALLYLKGDGVEKDSVIAVEWLLHSACGGYCHPQQLFTYDKERSNNNARSKLLELSALKNSPTHHYFLAITGCMYYAMQDYKNAELYYKRAIDKGSYLGTIELGLMYFYISANTSQLFEDSGEDMLGLESYMFKDNTACLEYVKTKNWTETDNVAYWLEIAVENGFGGFKYGSMSYDLYDHLLYVYVDGVGAMRNFEKAIDVVYKSLTDSTYDNNWFQEATLKIVEKNPKYNSKLFNTYTKLYEYILKHPNAHNNVKKITYGGLGKSYYMGLGVDKNYNNAFIYLSKAAEYGNCESMRLLAACYRYGQGTQEDMEKEKEWSEKAKQCHD